MNEIKNRQVPYLPLLFALLLLTGIFIGTRIPPGNKSASLFSRQKNYNKINDLVGYIKDSYVDTVNEQQLYESAIDGLLQSLDPHSAFIRASDFHEATDPLKGNFEGIGVQFRLVNDSVVVINTVSGGPSEKAGLKAGDRIVSVNGTSITGGKISDEDVVKKLKGPKGSQVSVGIFRRGFAQLLSFTLTRDKIPTFSVDASYMIQPGTGFIKLSRFSATTSQEVKEAIQGLLDKGMKNLILDLRDNSGGYLQSAIDLADEFLPSKAMIVYTEGRKRPRERFFSDGNGLFQQGKLIVLIDEGSASASEIVAGAIQDNDRGTLIGRRSFGKGLVQEELDFKDGSAVRLTVARYYTPTGRCIQKPYTKNNLDYTLEPMKRFLNGETEHPDSIKFSDSLRFKTPKGKIVYGGGGIMPDIYVAVEKNDHLALFNKLANSGAIYQFAFEYTDRNRETLEKYRHYQTFDSDFKVTDNMLTDLLRYAGKKGVQIDTKLIPGSRSEIYSYLKSLIARDIFDDQGFYPIYNKTDKTVLKAVEVVNR
jgi:carboxyl-terminal processing protease